MLLAVVKLVVIPLKKKDHRFLCAKWLTREALLRNRSKNPSDQRGEICVKIISYIKVFEALKNLIFHLKAILINMKQTSNFSACIHQLKIKARLTSFDSL